MPRAPQRFIAQQIQPLAGVGRPELFELRRAHGFWLTDGPRAAGALALRGFAVWRIPVHPERTSSLRRGRCDRYGPGAQSRTLLRSKVRFKKMQKRSARFSAGRPFIL